MKTKKENAKEKKTVKFTEGKTEEKVRKRKIETCQLENNALNGGVEKQSFRNQLYSIGDKHEHVGCSYEKIGSVDNDDTKPKNKRRKEQTGDNGNSHYEGGTHVQNDDDKKTYNRKMKEETERKKEQRNEKRDEEKNEEDEKEEKEEKDAENGDDGEKEEENDEEEGKEEDGDEKEDEEEDEEEDAEEDDEEEIDELKCFGIALELPKRQNRGKNMKKLMGDDLEKDQLFWNHDTWEEDEHDSEYVNSEGEEEYQDITDSDFDISEDNSEDEEDCFDNEEAEEKKKKKQMVNSYLEKLKRKKKKDDEIRFRHLKKRKLNIFNAENMKQKSNNQKRDSGEVVESTPRRGRGKGRRQFVVDADCLVLNRSKRDTTKQKTEEIKRLTELRKLKREMRHQKYCANKLKKLSSQKVMTRKERMEEVKITEKYNMESLIQLQAWEEKKRRYQEYKKMMQYNTTRVFVSFGYNTNKTLPTVNVNKYYPYVYWGEDCVMSGLPPIVEAPQEALYLKLENQEIVDNDANRLDLKEKKEISEEIKKEETLANEVKQETCGDGTLNNCYSYTKVENQNNIKKEKLEENQNKESQNENTTKKDISEVKEDANECPSNSKDGSDRERNQRKECEGVVDVHIGDSEVTEKQMYIFRNENELHMYSNYNDHKVRLENVKNKNNRCAITKLEGRYFDPLTKLYYYNKECFKVLRYLYFKKKCEEKAKGIPKKKKPVVFIKEKDAKELPKVKKRKKRRRRKTTKIN